MLVCKGLLALESCSIGTSWLLLYVMEGFQVMAEECSYFDELLCKPWYLCALTVNFCSGLHVQRLTDV